MLDECLDGGREKVRKEVEEGGEWGEIGPSVRKGDQVGR